MRILLSIAVVLIAVTAQAQNTSRFFSGSYKYTGSEFTINANTINGSDNGRMNISGGGGLNTNTARGGYVSVYGSDRGGAGNGGDVNIVTGDNGDILLNVTGATGYLDFWTNNLQKWFIAPTVDADSELYFGRVDTPNWYGKILASTLDGADEGRLSLSGGGAVGTTRGGRIDLYGADRGGAGNGGDVIINAADSGDIDLNSYSSGGINIRTGTSGYIDFITAGDQKWFIPPTVEALSELYFGSLGVPNLEAGIYASSNDGSDSGRLTVSGGGGLGVGRGARIDLYGSDRGGLGQGGDLFLISGDAGDIELNTYTTGDISFKVGASGYIDFQVNGETKWFVAPTAAGVEELYYGEAGLSNYTARILAATADGADDARLTISGGGASGSTRGGRIDLYGSDRGGADQGGDIVLAGGGIGDISLVPQAGGHIVHDALAAGSHVYVKDSAGGTWSDFGAVSTTTACTVTNGDYVTIKINGVSKRMVLCD